MSWLYRVFKLNPYSTTGRNEGEIQVNKVSRVSFDASTVVATVSTLTKLDLHDLTTLALPAVTAINLDSTAAPTLNFTYPNIAIFASTATPWLTAKNNAGTAGPGSLWLCTSGSMFIKTSTGTVGWITVMAIAT